MDRRVSAGVRTDDCVGVGERRRRVAPVALRGEVERPPSRDRSGRRPLVPLVQAMLQRSAHFRQQCRALVGTSLGLRASAGRRGGRADEPVLREVVHSAHVRRPAHRPSSASDARRTGPEWIPHELEHVLETAEGMRTADFVARSRHLGIGRERLRDDAGDSRWPRGPQSDAPEAGDGQRLNPWLFSSATATNRGTASFLRSIDAELGAVVRSSVQHEAAEHRVARIARMTHVHGFQVSRLLPDSLMETANAAQDASRGSASNCASVDCRRSRCRWRCRRRPLLRSLEWALMTARADDLNRWPARRRSGHRLWRAVESPRDPRARVRASCARRPFHVDSPT